MQCNVNVSPLIAQCVRFCNSGIKTHDNDDDVHGLREVIALMFLRKGITAAYTTV